MMSPEMLESIRERAEKFPVLALVQESWTDAEGREAPCPDAFMLEEVGVLNPWGGKKYLGGIEASFRKAEAEFVSEARGDVLALVAEIKRLRGENP